MNNEEKEVVEAIAMLTDDIVALENRLVDNPAKTLACIERLPPLQRASIEINDEANPGRGLVGSLSEQPDGSWSLELCRRSVQRKGGRTPLQIHVVAETEDDASEIFKALARVLGEGVV